ncbi:MAG: CHAT domain-containing protein [Thermoanaerobaculia bacterium]
MKPIVLALVVLCLGFPGAAIRGASPPATTDLLAAADREKAAEHWDAAVTAYDAARAAAARNHDQKSEAASLLGMANGEFQRGNYDACAKLASQSLGLFEKLGERASQADALKLIGNVQFQKGNLASSRCSQEGVLEIREELGDRGGVAVALNNIASTYKLSDPMKAIDYLDRSQREFKAIGDPRRATVLNNLGINYENLGDYSRAAELCGEALALAEKNENRYVIGAALNALGVAETYRGDYNAALRYYARALETQTKADFTWGIAEVFNNTGLVYQAQQDHVQAISYFSRSLELDRKLGDQSLQAEAENNLASEYFALGRSTDALAHYRGSLALSRRNSYPGLAAETLTGLARLHRRSGQIGGAIGEAKEAVAIERKIPDTRRLADSLALMAFLELESRRPSEALKISREAAETAVSVENWDALWQARLASGRALLRLGRSSESAQAFDASIATIEAERVRIAGPPESLPLYFANKLEPYQERVRLLLSAGKTGDALALVERSKSRVLFDVLRSGRVGLDRVLTAAERGKERKLKNELVSLDLRIEQEPANSFGRSKREKKRRELEALRTTLYAEHPELKFQRGNAPALSVDQISDLAKQTGALLLDYFVTPLRTYLFTIAPGSKPRVHAIPISRKDLDNRANELRRELASHDLGYSASLKSISDLLLAPVASELSSSSRIVIVPDGPLWSVSFHALQPKSGRYLIEEASVSYAPSLAVLKETERMARQRGSSSSPPAFLAMGNPKTALPALPDAERQVREIGELYGVAESEVLIGDAATERRFRDEAPRFRVLHLAAHAVLDDVNPMYSHILLSAGGGEDGLLEARKLMELDLKAEMLVLSGCETARGDAPAGEGITGMLWAAFVAGVPTTVASLWRVESASTSALMIEFHRQWLANRGKSSFAKAEALRAAARKLIASGRYAHPFYWAGFILAGSPG